MNNLRPQPVTLLVADDDADDRLLLKEALEVNRLANTCHFVEDGEQVMDYLLGRGQYQCRASHPRPGLILLDLNMPKKDGREVLNEIKQNPALRDIPVVILTTSRVEEDIARSYGLGVNSYISKPVSFDSLVSITRDLGRYWFEIVELPPSCKNSK